MYIAKVPNRNSPPAILIRESYREGGKPKKRTVANISKWKPTRIEALRQSLCANILETIRSLKLVSRAEEDHR